MHHSFIKDIYIALLQETYSEALSVQLRQQFSTCESQCHGDRLTIYWGSAGICRNLQTKLSAH